MTNWIVFAFLISFGTAWGQSSADRAAQWIYRPADSTHSETLAVFLSWDYSSVVFRVWCEKRKQLVIQYFLESGLNTKDTGMAIYLNEKSYPVAAKVGSYGSSAVLEGRVTLTAKLARDIQEAQEVDIVAPSDSEEPFYTGAASALKRVAKACS